MFPTACLWIFSIRHVSSSSIYSHDFIHTQAIEGQQPQKSNWARIFVSPDSYFFGVVVLLLPGAIRTKTKEMPMLVYYQQLECGVQDPSSTVANHSTSILLLGWKDELSWSSEQKKKLLRVQGMADKWKFRWLNFRKLEKHTICLLFSQRDLSHVFQCCPLQLDWGHHGHICLTMRYNILRGICRLPAALITCFVQ
jgi:hypothetical protein